MMEMLAAGGRRRAGHVAPRWRCDRESGRIGTMRGRLRQRRGREVLTFSGMWSAPWPSTLTLRASTMLAVCTMVPAFGPRWTAGLGGRARDRCQCRRPRPGGLEERCRTSRDGECAGRDVWPL